MGSVFRCCTCCDVDEEADNQYTQVTAASSSVVAAPMNRGGGSGTTHDSTIAVGYQQESETGGLVAAATAESHEEEEEEENEGSECCRLSGTNNNSSENSSSPETNQEALSIHNFFRALRERWRTYDSFQSLHGDNRTRTLSDVAHPYDIMRTTSEDDSDLLNAKKKISSPLKQASSFDSSSGIPTIHAEEIVLPGSLLQQEMAKKMAETLHVQDDECVICMEGFDPSNPRMPTLCGCGENKTYFHLPCLYQWIEQSSKCPSCRKKLTWEEF